ncbi:MAG: hypothetical protein KAT20_01595, partial [Desulfuromonadales bacterium]|nr:hypothetical protein [Desulfuromonadales bacterium]
NPIKIRPNVSGNVMYPAMSRRGDPCDRPDCDNHHVEMGEYKIRPYDNHYCGREKQEFRGNALA